MATVSKALWAAALVLAGCGSDDLDPVEPGPALGMTLARDGVIYAGVASVDITPVLGESFEDLNDNQDFDGCVDDPTASREGCEEPFDDANGNGIYDPVWIGGFGPKRPALEVHDPIYARAVVLSFDESYVALVALDLVGLGSPRINQAKAALAADGFEADRLIVSSSHNHDGPDTMGLWGDPETFTSGLDLSYQQALAENIERAVRTAAAAMVPVRLRIGEVAMRDVDPTWFNGAQWGGKNPDRIMRGLIHDGRDPVIVSDQLLVVQGLDEADGTVFTLTNWSGHPEVRGSANNAISSDYVGTLRDVLEAQLGGVALHVPESLGGMQSTLNGDVPLVDDDGQRVFQVCDAGAVADDMDADCFGLAEGSPRIDGDGDEVPVWAERNSWDFVRSLGWHLAYAALDALDAGETVDHAPVRLDTESLYVAVENQAYNLLAPFDLFELGLDDAVFDPALCPEMNERSLPLGCVRTTTSRLQVGPIGWTAVPGELLPELAWGLPEEDPRWMAEVDDPFARGEDAMATYFPQHDPACNDVDYSVCQQALSLDDCDCRAIHAWPYALSPESSQLSLLSAWDDSDVRYRAAIGMANDYLSYIIPEPDFNLAVSLLEEDGDHYEDTVSPAHRFATRVQAAQSRIDARWSTSQP